MNKRKKIYIISVVVIFILAVTIAFVFVLHFNGKKGKTSSSEDYSPKVTELKQTLLDFANTEIDNSLDKKEEIYDVDDLVSLSIATNKLSYSSYNNNYLFTIDMDIDDTNDIISSIKNHHYQNVEIKYKEIVKSEINPLLEDVDFKSNINGNNYKSFLSKTNDIYRYIDITYLGNDDKYYSLSSYKYKNGEFNIEGIEEALYGVSKSDKPVLYELLKTMI